MIVGIMIASCYINRLRGYSIIPSRKQDEGLLGHDKLGLEDEEALLADADDEQEASPAALSTATATTSHPSKKRSCCGMVVHTPNSSRYANYWHSRFIQKFPFLVEMFYWAVNLLFYVSVKQASELIFATDGVWQTAENHGVAVLALEHESPFSFLFPVREVDVQHFFRNGHQGMLTVLNRAYSLIHIPVTVSFLAWYYYAAPTFEQFAAARRMMTFTNLFSFVVFTTYPCMPPRLLPKKYGFFDTVRREDAESIYATNKFFNQLAAFPSLHFGYAFCIGTVLMYHSGIFRRRLAPREKRMSKLWQIFFATLSIVYPAFVLLIIVSTANHYYLDALAATGVVGVAWLCNRSLLTLLPLEDLFLWAVKLEKPIPTTGRRRS
ncbi:putative integral membrane protein [Phaeoacremonium minimum UCRPA7]|uniref:Putative integral membrane protein n=1 Tax=Phaeoacremonium minimum (strain UCR-PA7) TaxID=1286976 RepID=R8BXR2_PHAM7|nr:putative integral membrane protein [Phaeoacremonium minimum UCRPA7]EOO04069.1 putative integral membrane protein [Phaeoacremonium minimum UCRPA7]